MAYKRQPQRRKNKRWYVDARIGKNVPIIGGTGFVAGSGARAMQRRAIQNIVKRQVIKGEETKERVTRVTGTNLTHYTVYNLRLNDIPQGTLSSQRVGDSVFYCGITMKFTLQPAQPNTYWRFYVVKHRDTNATTDATHFEGGSPVVGSSLLFRNSDVSSDSYLNTDDVSVVCAKTLKIDPKYTGETNVVRNFRMNCKIMKNFQFRTSTASTPTNEGQYYNYYLIVVPLSNTSGQQLPSSIVGTLNVSIEQVYKDA